MFIFVSVFQSFALLSLCPILRFNWGFFLSFVMKRFLYFWLRLLAPKPCRVAGSGLSPRRFAIVGGNNRAKRALGEPILPPRPETLLCRWISNLNIAARSSGVADISRRVHYSKQFPQINSGRRIRVPQRQGRCWRWRPVGTWRWPCTGRRVSRDVNYRVACSCGQIAPPPPDTGSWLPPVYVTAHPSIISRPEGCRSRRFAWQKGQLGSALRAFYIHGRYSAQVPIGGRPDVRGGSLCRRRGSLCPLDRCLSLIWIPFLMH